MTVRLHARLAYGLLAGMLASCGHSPPTAFFTLDPVPAQTNASTAGALAPVQLDAVHIPAALDRPQLVTETGANRLRLSDQDQWGAPLGEMMRRTLAQDLDARLPKGSFVFPDAPHPTGVRALVVTVLQLTASPDGQVTLEANWSLLAAGSAKPLQGQNLTLQATAAAGPSGEASAISQALGQLSDRIAAELSQG